MSVEIVREAWEANAGSPAAKLVLVALADSANREGECWPSVPTLAEACELSRAAVFVQLAKLESLGLLSRRAVPGRSTRYTVTPKSRKKKALRAGSEELPPVQAVDGATGGPPVQELDPSSSKTRPGARRDPSRSWTRNHKGTTKEPSGTTKGVRGDPVAGTPPDGSGGESLGGVAGGPEAPADANDTAGGGTERQEAFPTERVGRG